MRNFIQSTIVLSFTLCFLTSCNKLDDSGIDSTRTEELFAFDAVDIKGEFILEFVQGSPSAVIDGDQSVVDAIEIKQSGTQLTIGFDKHYHFINIENPISIQLSTNNIEKIKAFGENRIELRDEFSLEELSLDLDGANTFVSQGTVEELNLSLLGENTVNAYNMISQNAFIQTTGENRVELSCDNQMDIKLFGECEIYYKGFPNIEQEVFGSGKIVSMN